MLSEPGEAAERSAQARAARALSGAFPAAPGRSPRQRQQYLPPDTPPAIATQAGTGRPLRPADAVGFGSQLGADLGHVRIHDDDAAAALAEAAHARAFTLGSHLFFNRGEYQPGTRSGRALLAHELAHVADAAVGPARLLRQPKPKIPDPQNLALEPGDAPDTYEAVIEQITTVVALSVSQPGHPSLLTLRTHWREAYRLIIEPKGLGKPAPGTLFADLHDPDLAAQLGAMTLDARLAVAAEVQRRVIGMLQSNPLAKLKDEFGQLKPAIRENLDGGFLSWVAMREGMFRCFVDIPKMNEYYRSLVAAEFPSSKIKGNRTLVHPILKAKLDRARDLIIRNSWLPEVEAALTPLGLWATDIRENTAHPSDIGSHAFGWAVDFAANMNPDIRPFPEIFADVIETDAGAGSSVMALRDPKISTAKALTEAKVLRASSDAIVAAFANKDAVIKAISGYLNRQGAGTLEAADQKALAALLDVAAAAKGRKEKDAAAAAVTDWVLARQDRVRSAQQLPVSDPDAPATKYSSVSMEDSLWVISMTSALRRLSSSQADLDARLVLIERQIDAPVSRASRQAHGLGLDSIYSQSSVATLKAMDAAHKYRAMTGLRDNLQLALNRTVATNTAARVLEIHQLFLAVEHIRGTAPQSRPTAAGVAAHGWLSLPPVLIASLVSKEGAGLMWLGVMTMVSHGRTVGAKDSMHFEIWPSERPMLPAGRYPDVLGHPKSPGDFVSPDSAETA